MSDRVWHYTTSLSIGHILRDGLITCSEPCYLHPLPTVFCTTSPRFVAYGDATVAQMAGMSGAPGFAARKPVAHSRPTRRPLSGYLHLAATEGIDAALLQVEADMRQTELAPPPAITTYRIEVRPEAAPLAWDAFVAAGGVSAFGVCTLPRERDIVVGRWRMSLSAIPRLLWLAVEHCQTSPFAALCVDSPPAAWTVVDSDAIRSLASVASGSRRQGGRESTLAGQVLKNLTDGADYTRRCLMVAWAKRAEVSAQRLLELEATIDASRGDTLRVGQALAEIRDRRLYESILCPTFRVYCWDQWHLTWSRAREVVGIAEAASEDGRHGDGD